MEGGVKRHRNRGEMQVKAENLEAEKKSKRINLSVKVKNSFQGHSAEFKSGDQEKRAEKEDGFIDWQPTKEEREKLILMWTGVIFFMAIIIVGWAVMFEQTFSVAKNDGQSLLDWQKWNQTASDIGKNFDATAGQLQTMKNLLSQAAAQSASGTNAITATNNGVSATSLNQTELNNMKTKILELQLEKATTTK